MKIPNRWLRNLSAAERGTPCAPRRRRARSDAPYLALMGLLFVAALFLAGCGEKSNSPSGATNSASSGGNPLDAPANYLRAVANAKESAVKTVGTTSLDNAIRSFSVEQGRYPKDLNELVPKYIPQIPSAPYGMKFAYDADSGSVKVVKE